MKTKKRERNKKKGSGSVPLSKGRTFKSVMEVINDPSVPKPKMPSIMGSLENNKSVRVKMVKDKCAYLYHTGEPFVLTKSGTSYKLESRFFKSKAFRAGFKSADVAFIKKVKRHIVSNDIADNFIDRDYLAEKIFYIEVKEYAEGEVLNDIVEIDINWAYWQTAYLMGIISKGIYNQGLSIDKRVRLACLGTLAKRTTTWEYDGKEFKKLKEERSYDTENIWFAICRRVSDVMRECLEIAGDDFVFYWVDGIYVRNNADVIGRIMQCFAKWGYEGKIKQVDEIVFHHNAFTVQGRVSDDRREFVYNTGDSVKSIRAWNEDQKLRKLAEEIFFNRRDARTVDMEEVDVL